MPRYEHIFNVYISCLLRGMEESKVWLSQIPNKCQTLWKKKKTLLYVYFFSFILVLFAALTVNVCSSYCNKRTPQTSYSALPRPLCKNNYKNKILRVSFHLIKKKSLQSIVISMYRPRPVYIQDWDALEDLIKSQYIHLCYVHEKHYTTGGTQ